MDLTGFMYVTIGIVILTWIFKMIKKGIILIVTIGFIAIVSSFVFNGSTANNQKAEQIVQAFGQQSWDLLSGTIAIIKASNLDLNIAEGKINFSNKNGFTGEIAKQEKALYLKTMYPTDDKQNIDKLLNIIGLFTHSNEVKDRLVQLIDSNTDEKVMFGDGSYANVAQGILTIYIEKQLPGIPK